MRYVIVPTADVTQEMLDASTSNSVDTARKSLDGTLTMLEIEEVSALFLDYNSYTNAEAIELTKTDPAWNENEGGGSFLGGLLSFFGS